MKIDVWLVRYYSECWKMFQTYDLTFKPFLFLNLLQPRQLSTHILNFSTFAISSQHKTCRLFFNSDNHKTARRVCVAIKVYDWKTYWNSQKNSMNVNFQQNAEIKLQLIVAIKWFRKTVKRKHSYKIVYKPNFLQSMKVNSFRVTSHEGISNELLIFSLSDEIKLFYLPKTFTIVFSLCNFLIVSISIASWCLCCFLNAFKQLVVDES